MYILWAWLLPCLAKCDVQIPNIYVQLYFINHFPCPVVLFELSWINAAPDPCMLYYCYNSQSMQNDRPSMCTQFYKQLMSQITVHDACDVTCHMNLRIISCSANQAWYSRLTISSPICTLYTAFTQHVIAALEWRRLACYTYVYTALEFTGNSAIIYCNHVNDCSVPSGLTIVKEL